MDIDLKVNNVAFTPGEQLSRQKLTLARFEKPGLLGRLVMKPPSGYVVYQSINCEISCFGGKFMLWANLDPKSGSAAMSGTSTFLYFKNDILESIKFQVLSNETVAIGGVASFEELCKGAFGASAPGSPPYWLDNHAAVFCSLFRTGDKALFVWKTRRNVEEQGLLA